jgi:hypothetical protein
VKVTEVALALSKWGTYMAYSKAAKQGLSDTFSRKNAVLRLSKPK